MRFLSRLSLYNPLKSTSAAFHLPSSFRFFSSAGANSGNGGGDDEWTKTPIWPDVSTSWSTGLTKEHFDGEAVGRQIDPSQEAPSQSRAGPTATSQFANARWTEREIDVMKELEAENKKGKAFVNGWGERMREMSVLLKQVREPGARGSYLKDSEKAEMYKLHKENPEVYTVEKLAKDYRIMRQRVHAILWLKELEEEEEKKLGHPLDDSVELLLDTCPE